MGWLVNFLSGYIVGRSLTTIARNTAAPTEPQGFFEQHPVLKWLVAAPIALLIAYAVLAAIVAYG